MNLYILNVKLNTDRKVNINNISTFRNKQWIILTGFNHLLIILLMKKVVNYVWQNTFKLNKNKMFK